MPSSRVLDVAEARIFRRGPGPHRPGPRGTPSGERPAPGPGRPEALLEWSTRSEVASSGPLTWTSTSAPPIRALDAFTTACLREGDSEAIWHWGRHGILARATPASALALLGARPAAGLVGRAAAIACPTLVIAGEQDAIALPAAARALAEAIRGARFLFLEGAGHVPTLTRPDEIAVAMEELLG